LIFEICHLIFVSACGSTHPVIKFGLVAPFEGRYRPIGYDAIYAARLAVRERNASGGVGGYRVELVAYDDGGDAQAAVERARQLALDPQVMAVIGHFRVDTTRVAWDVYAREALPLIAPVIPADALPDSPCAGCSFPAAFRTGPVSQAIGESIGLDLVFSLRGRATCQRPNRSSPTIGRCRTARSRDRMRGRCIKPCRCCSTRWRAGLAHPRGAEPACNWRRSSARRAFYPACQYMCIVLIRAVSLCYNDKSSERRLGKVGGLPSAVGDHLLPLD